MGSLRMGTVSLVAAALGVLAVAAQPALATHVECNQTITEDTTLDSDLTNCHLRGVVIGAPGVTLDLNGHVIDGSEPTGEPAGTEGVMNAFDPGTSEGFENVTVVNGTIRGFDDNVELWGDGHRVQGLTLENAEHGDATFLMGAGATVTDSVFRSQNFATGLSLGVDGGLVAGNRFEDTHHGISLGFSDDVVVEDNVLIGAGRMSFGITLSGDRNVVRRNMVSGVDFLSLGVHSVGIEVAVGNVVEDNVVAGNGGGVHVGDAVATGVRRNSLTSAGDRIGIILGNSVASRVTSNRVSGYFNGLWVTQSGSADNLIAKNRLSRSTQDGLIVWPDASGTTLDRNRADGNGDDGIDVRNAATSLAKNRADRNGDLGIEAVVGVEDGGGNRARRNGNSDQCVNVGCR